MTGTRERRVLTKGSEVRIRPDGRLEGYAIVFGARSDDLGGFVEVVERGAVDFDPDLVSTFNHRPELLLGRRSANTLAVEVDRKGVRYEVELPDTSAGRDVRELVRRGDVRGSSFTFDVLEGGQRWSRAAEVDLRALTRIRVYELGPVTMPAYPDTTAAVRELARAREGSDRGSARPDLGRYYRRQRLSELQAGMRQR
jgi:hypothetical protein